MKKNNKKDKALVSELSLDSNEALEFAESIINTIREPLIVLDQDLRAIKASRSFYDFFKVTPDETIGTLIYDLGNHQYDIPKLRELLETILPEKTTFDNYEVEHIFSTIGKRIMLLNARKIQRALGKEKIILLAIEDITERKEIEERHKKEEQKLQNTLVDLERCNKDLEQFAYVASHDLQEPLRMVSSYTQLLARRYKDKLDQDANDFINFAVDGANRMQQLINDLLDYSRIATRGKEFQLLDANSLLSRALINLQYSIQSTSAVITNDELPYIRVDGEQIIRLFQNLIDNAIKFVGHDPPRIHISCKEYSDSWQFSFRDNGIGIDEKYKETVFIVFQRLHTRKEYPGTGIGLSICKRIVERHGGKIWFEPAPENGTIFYVTISKWSNNE